MGVIIAVEEASRDGGPAMEQNLICREDEEGDAPADAMSGLASLAGAAAVPSVQDAMLAPTDESRERSSPQSADSFRTLRMSTRC